jgi:hypothetical protein
VIAVLARPSVARVFGTPRAWMTLGAWCVLALGFALAARSRGAANGADHVLVGAYGALILPLLAYSLVGAVVGGRSLGAATVPLVRFGAAPGTVAAVTVAFAVTTGVVVGAAMAAVVAVVAHGVGDPPLATDALESAYAGALGASFGKRGGGRTALLVLDWILGLGRGAVAVLVPRAHVRSLLGGTGPLEWSGRASAVALVVIAMVCAAIAFRRAART